MLNKRILPSEISQVIAELNNEFPDIVFGGSIALNVVGLINRTIGDIDIFIPENHQILSSKYVKDYKAKDVENFSFEENTCTRTGIYINDIKVCIFEVSNLDQLQCSKYSFNDSTINIQNVNHCIIAKTKYLKQKFCVSREKHVKDLQQINSWLGNSDDLEQITDWLETSDDCPF